MHEQRGKTEILNRSFLYKNIIQKITRKWITKIIVLITLTLALNFNNQGGTIEGQSWTEARAS